MYKVLNLMMMKSRVNKDLFSVTPEKSETLEVEINGTTLKRTLQSVAVFLEVKLSDITVSSDMMGKCVVTVYEHEGSNVIPKSIMEDFQNGLILLDKITFTFDIIEYHYTTMEEIENIIKEEK